jgi:NAD(P)-dependent dehydrogenase (short-subunit alcohol dehydrogenase family)
MVVMAAANSLDDGIYRDRRIGQATEEDFDLTMSVHIKGAFNIVKNAWPVDVPNQTNFF